MRNWSTISSETPRISGRNIVFLGEDGAGLARFVGTHRPAPGLSRPAG